MSKFCSSLLSGCAFRYLVLFIVVLGLLLFRISYTFGQTGRTLRGVVVDSSDGAIADASVSLHTATTVLQTTPDNHGQFVFTNLPAGEYEIVVTRRGFSQSTTKGIQISDRDLERLKIVLQPGPISSCSSGCVQESKEVSPTIASLPSYPDSPDGLKKLIEDILGVVKSGDTEKASLYFSSFEIPDNEAWFLKTFGPVEGPRLGAKYQELLPQEPGRTRRAFDYALTSGRTDAAIRLLKKPAETNSGLSHAVIEAMLQPTTIYIVDGTSPAGKFPAFIGEFVYLDGGFRYLDTQVIQELSTSPPLRIRVGGNVQVASLVHKVQPIYPDEARAAHLSGSVILHVIIAIDGTLQAITIDRGDPVLGKAAVDAVRQWRYKPTLLNGKPVEVDTTITIEFRP
jgi:TonB family protein